MALYKLILTGLSPASQKALADAIAAKTSEITAVELFSAPNLSQPRTSLYHVIAEDNRFEKIRNLQVLLEKIGCEACVVDETSSLKRAKDRGRLLIRATTDVWKELRELFSKGKLLNMRGGLRRLGRIPGWAWLVVALSCLMVFTVILLSSQSEEQPDTAERQATSAVAEFWLDVAEQETEVDADQFARDSNRHVATGPREAPRESPGAVGSEEPEPEQPGPSRRWILAFVGGFSLALFGGIFVTRGVAASDRAVPALKRWRFLAIFAAVFCLAPAVSLLIQEKPPPPTEPQQAATEAQPAATTGAAAEAGLELPSAEEIEAIAEGTGEELLEEMVAAIESTDPEIVPFAADGESPCAGIELSYPRLLCEIERRYPRGGNGASLIADTVADSLFDDAMVEPSELATAPTDDFQPSAEVDEQASVSDEQAPEAPGEGSGEHVGDDDTREPEERSAPPENPGESTADGEPEPRADAPSEPAPQDAVAPATADATSAAPEAAAPSETGASAPEAADVPPPSIPSQAGDNTQPQGEPRAPERAEPGREDEGKSKQSPLQSILARLTTTDVASFEIGFLLGLIAVVIRRRMGARSDAE